MKDLVINFAEVESHKTVKEYEKDGKNYIQVEVAMQDGRDIKDNNCSVNITMSRDAMVAFAVNLLNAVYNPKSSERDDRMWEWYPAHKGNIVDVLGIAMHPESCVLRILENNDCGSILKIVDGDIAKE